MGRKRKRRRRKLQVLAPAARGVTLTNRGFLKTMTVTHREFVREIVNTTPGPNQVSSLRMQPGDADAFPWLSDIALRFESYKFQSLSLEFIPDVGTDTNGSVAICPDYDAADDNSSATRAKLFAFEDSVRGPLWNPMTCHCSRNNLHKRNTYYCAATNSHVNDNLYDTGNFWISLNYEGTEPTIGELWVSYTIVLMTPQLEPELIDSVVFSKLYDSDDYNTPFANVTRSDTGDIGVQVKDGNTLEFTKPGTYRMLSRLRPALDIANRFFNSAWKVAPYLVQNGRSNSVIVPDSHEVCRFDSNSNDYADNEVLYCTVYADNNTTRDRPLELVWTSWASDISHSSTTSWVHVEIHRITTAAILPLDVLANVGVRAITPEEAQELPVVSRRA